MDASLGVRKHGLGQGVPGLALGKACLAFHPETGVLDPIQLEEGSLDPADLIKRKIQPVLLSVGAELAQHLRGLYGHGFDTCRQSHGVISMIEYDFFVDRPSHERGQGFPLTGPAEAGEASVREVPQARNKGQVEEMKQCKDMIGHAASVDMVHQRIELRCVSDQSVKNEWRLARRGADHFRVERSVLPGQEGIDFQARVDSVLRVGRGISERCGKGGRGGRRDQEYPEAGRCGRLARCTGPMDVRVRLPVGQQEGARGGPGSDEIHRGVSGPCDGGRFPVESAVRAGHADGYAG